MKYSLYPDATDKKNTKQNKRVATNPCDNIYTIRSMYKIRCDSREWMTDSVSGRIREIISRIQVRDDNYTREVREIQQSIKSFPRVWPGYMLVSPT